MTKPPDPVTLAPTREEVDQARSLALRRQGAKDRAHVRTRRFEQGEDDYSIHFWAAKAEILLARYLGGSVDSTITAAGTHRGNVILPDLRRAMVKVRAARYRDLALNGSTMASFYGDLALLAWLEGPWDAASVDFVGWLPRAEFEEQAAPTEFLRGQPRLVVSWRRLRPPPHLRDGVPDEEPSARQPNLL